MDKNKIISFSEKKMKKKNQDDYSVETLANVFFRNDLDYHLQRMSLDETLNGIFTQVVMTWIEIDPTVSIERIRNLVTAMETVRAEIRGW